MATPYNVNKNLQGVNGFGSHFSDNIYNATLAATTDTSFTVPGFSSSGASPLPYSNNKYLAVFKYAKAEAKDVFVALNATAAAPAGASFAAATSVLNPEAKVVKAGDVIHFFAVTASTNVTIELYPIQE